MRWPGSGTLAALLLAVALAACARRVVRPIAPEVDPSPDTSVRILIAQSPGGGRVSSTSLLTIVDGSSGALLATSRAGTPWVARTVDNDGVELAYPDADPIIVRRSAIILRADRPAGVVMYDGRRYRGTLTLWRDGDRLLVVNNLPVEEYLLGVVPLEIGARTDSEREAVAAQAVSARSYTYVRIAVRRRDSTSRHDLIASVTDQAYGGMDSEVQIASDQVRATRGLVVKFAGRVVEALYSSSCGGATAEAAEVWPFGGQPYLRSVSDSIPRGQGFYCDIAPRPTWSASLNAASLVAGVDQYLRNYVTVNERITWVDSVVSLRKTASGRTGSVALFSNAGKHELAGDRIRFVLRPPNGEILRSTMFEFLSVRESGAGLVRLEIRGRGNGHGVGMCQWGAIGRARAGHTFRDILAAYFPGTTVEDVNR